MDKVQNILKLDKSDVYAAFANNVLAADLSHKQTIK